MKQLTLATLALAVTGSGGLAQAPADSVDSAQVRLAPVTVTATRQATSLFATPLAVTLIDRQKLENKRGYSFEDAVASVPGVLAQSRYGASDVRITIRGFGARGAGDRSNAGTSRGIRVLIDGIPETEPDGRTSFDLVDLAAASRIEIVRSNASALWGNAGGGVIDISTVPEFERRIASVQLTGGSHGFLRTVVQAGSRLGPQSLALTFTNTMQDGYRDHSDSRRALVNASLTTTADAPTRIGLHLAASNDLFHIPGPLTRAQAESAPRSANATYAARDERRHNRLARIGLSLRHDSDTSRSLSAMLFASPKVLERSERNTFREFDRYHVGGNLMYRSAFRLGGTAATTVIGADGAHQDGKIRFYSLAPDGTKGRELRENKAEGATNTGVFMQQELDFTGPLSIQAGARWDRIRYDYRSFIDPGLDAARTFSRVSPKIGINYRASLAHSLYASIGGGVEAPAGNETDPASTFGQDTVTAINPLLDPIISTTYEIGTRHAIPIRSGPFTLLTYDAALYNTNVRNEIVPYRGGRFYFTAGRVRRQGAELAATLLGPSDLEIAGSVTSSRNRYLTYRVDSVHYGRPGTFADYAGNDVAGIPGLFYSFSVSRRPFQSVPVRAQLAVRGVGRYFADDANQVGVPAWATLGATLSTSGEIPWGPLAIRAFATMENVADRRYIGSAFINPDVVNGEPVAFEPAQGRTFILSVSVGSKHR